MTERAAFARTVTAGVTTGGLVVGRNAISVHTTASNPKRRSLLDLHIVALGLACAVVLAGCGSSSPETTATATSSAVTATASIGANAHGVSFCAYVPGTSQPATMPLEVVNFPAPTWQPTPTPPAQTFAPPETIQHQMGVFRWLRDRITATYVYPDFNGKDWEAIADRYEALIAGGLTDDDFYKAMDLMVAELGDDHSYFESPVDAAATQAQMAAGQNFVGIGAFVSQLPDGQTGSIVTFYPNSAAADAGLRPHDRLLTVDGLPFFDDSGTARSLGPEGTSLLLKFQRQGEEPQTVTIMRRPVSGFTPVDYCLVPNTRIGYILLPTFNEENVADEVRTALQKMTADSPLDGLVLDNRLNAGGLERVADAMLRFFTSDVQGSFVSRSGQRDLNVTAEDIGGSQTVPLVILADRDTESFAEVFTGVLQRSGRARVVGGQTAGNIEILTCSTVNADGSRVCLASEAFAPVGLEPGAWEGIGLVPDVSVPTRWDLFTEATDPALARAVELLQTR